MITYDEQSQFDKEPGKTEATLEAYFKRSQILLKKCKKELDLTQNDLLDPRQFAAWLIDLRPTLSKSSWRQYKSSVVCYLQQFNTQSSLDALDYISTHDSDQCKKNSDKTSSGKLKKFPLKDFQKITEHLKTTPGRWNKALYEWLICGCLTGLRPQEWKNAIITEINGVKALVIQNAKNTNGRAHGETRTLLLASFSTDELKTLENHVQRSNLWYNLNQFDDLYQGCSLTLYYVSRKIWPNRKRHITLYSCRHQFTANAKASGFSTLEIAAMMGHRVDTTATTHYGKKASGHELLRVKALESDIERVESRFSQKSLPNSKSKLMTEPIPNLNKH